MTIPDIHRVLFAGASNFNTGEINRDSINLNKSSPVFSVNTMERLCSVFGGAKNLAKCHKFGDISLITPWCVIKKSINNCFIEGPKVIPIKIRGDKTECFIMCEGLDPDTDQAPTWASNVPLNSLLQTLTEQDLLHIRKRAQGKITAFSGTDFVSMIPGQG